MSEQAPVDPLAFTRLRQFGGADFVREMIDLFVDYAPAKLAEAQAALNAGDREGIAKAVHPLKSSAGHIGAHRLLALATELESLAVTSSFADLAKRLHELENAHAEVVPILAKVRGELPVTST
jgi:HPt (histidine-containing phosphotransfer) domain-containing protein